MAKILTNTIMTEETTQETHKYLIPAGKDGFHYEPEILEVLKKFAKVNINLSDADSLEVLSSDIGKRIREIPLQTVELPDGPIRLINSNPMDSPKDG